MRKMAMAANLENTIQEKVKALPPEKQLRVLSMVEEMLTEKEVAPGNVEVRPLWKIAEEISAQVPLEEWQKLPADGAEQHDHYLYGSPKKDNG
jgi:hypothetical protein